MSAPVNWYYAANGQQIGPYDDAAFQALVANGQIQSTTLVWHSGMTGWKPFAEAEANAASPAVTAIAAEPQFYCSECGTRYPSDEMIQFGAARVCANCKDKFTQKIREGVTPGVLRQYGGFWIRFVARLLDGILLWIGFYGLAIVFGGGTGLLRGVSSGIFSSLFLLHWMTAAGYEILLVSKYGATLGKRVLGLRVITGQGGPIPLSLSAGRYLAQLVSSATLTIGYLMAAFDPEKRSLHDRICNTRVVKV